MIFSIFKKVDIGNKKNHFREKHIKAIVAHSEGLSYNPSVIMKSLGKKEVTGSVKKRKNWSPF